MPEYIRVFDKELKRKFSVPAEMTVEDGLEVLDDEPGPWLEPEFDVTRSGQPSASASGQKADTKKEIG
jgi:hypothetical protein